MLKSVGLDEAIITPAGAYHFRRKLMEQVTAIAPGRQVNFNLPKGQYRPAFISRVLDQDKGIVDLTIMCAGRADEQNGFRADEMQVGSAQRTGVEKGQETFNWSWPAFGEVSSAEISAQLTGVTATVAELSGKLEHLKAEFATFVGKAGHEQEALRQVIKEMKVSHPAAASGAGDPTGSGPGPQAGGVKP